MILLVGKFFLGILCFGALMVAIIVFLAFLCGFKDTMQDPDSGIHLKLIDAFLVLISFVTIIGWAITSAYLLGVIK
jgi:hypothetical protein